MHWLFLFLAIAMFVIGIVRIVRDHDAMWGVLLIIGSLFVIPVGNAILSAVSRG